MAWHFRKPRLDNDAKQEHVAHQPTFHEPSFDESTNAEARACQNNRVEDKEGARYSGKDRQRSIAQAAALELELAAMPVAPATPAVSVARNQNTFGHAHRMEANDEHQEKWAQQRQERGFDDTELWGLDVKFRLIVNFFNE